MANCSDITKFGIFDVSNTSRDEDLVASYLKWLQNQETNTRTEAANTSLGLGLPIPDFPLDFEGEHNETNTTTWGKRLSDYLNSNVEVKNRFREEFLTANASIVSAWRDCAVNTKGLVCWAEQTENPKEIILKIEVRPLVFPMVNRIKLTEIVTSPNVKTGENFVGDELGAGIYSIIYERTGNNWNDAVNFNIRTDDPNYADHCGAAAVPSTRDPLVPGLIAHWKGDGNAKDSIGKYHGIASHGVSYTAGFKDMAFNFDGGDRTMVATSLNMSYEHGASFEVYIKTFDDFGLIIADGGGASSGTGMGLFIEPGGVLGFFGSKGTEADFNFIAIANSINDGKFHHIVGTWTGDTTPNGVILYVDGRSVSFTTAKTNITKGSTPLYFGGHNTLGYLPYNGLIDNVRIYNRAIESDEVAKLHGEA